MLGNWASGPDLPGAGAEKCFLFHSVARDHLQSQLAPSARALKHLVLALVTASIPASVVCL